jgi:hypothetical protein
MTWDFLERLIMRALARTIISIAIATSITPALADGSHETTTASLAPIEHGPIGVMQDHMHKKGEWMLSYRYMRMDMGGNKAGTSAVSTADTLGQFMVAPTSMTMDMHMAGVMYGVSDQVTVTAMVPYSRKSMDHVTRMGGEFNTTTNGVGDIKLLAMIALLDQGKHRLHANIGISLPTGSIGQRAAIPINPDAQLPYAMQLGSRTWDILPGITYTGTSQNLYWGLQASSVVRIGTNSRDYSLGNRLQLTAWNMVRLSPAFDAGLRMTYHQWGNVDGADPELMPMLVQTANPSLQGGKRIDLAFALNFQVQNGSLKGHRLAAEISVPVYQNLDGPQMKQNWALTIGWQKAF